VKKFSDELIRIFKQWKKMEDQVTPIYLKMEELINQHLGSKKDDPIAHGRVIVELTSLTSPQSASTPQEGYSTSVLSTPRGNKLSEAEAKSSQVSDVPLPTTGEQ